MGREQQIFNAEITEHQKRIRYASLYLSHDKRRRFDILSRVLGFSKPGALLNDMIEFYEATTPGERAALLPREPVT